MKILAIEGGSGKSRYGRRRSRASINDKFVLCACASGGSFKCSLQTAKRKLAAGNSPIISFGKTSRVYYKELVDGVEHWIKFSYESKDQVKKVMASAGWVLKNGFVSQLQHAKSGAWLTCAGDAWKSLAVLRWRPPKYQICEDLIAEDLDIIPIGWFIKPIGGAGSEVAVELSVSEIEDGLYVLFVSSSAFKGNCLNKKFTFELNPYISFEEDSIAISKYVSTAIISSSPVLETTIKSLISRGLKLVLSIKAPEEEDAVKIDADDLFAYTIGSKLTDLSVVDPAELAGLRIIDLTSDGDGMPEKKKEAVLKKRAERQLKFKYNEDEVRGADEIKVAEILNEFTKIFEEYGFKLDKTGCSNYAIAAVTLWEGLTEVFSVEMFSKNADVVHFEASIKDNLQLLASAGYVTSALADYITTHSEPGSESESCFNKASQLVSMNINSFRVSTEPRPSSKDTWSGFDPETGDFVVVTGTPLYHFTSSNYSLWDSLGSYSFLECDNPGSQGFNNDIPNNANKNLTSKSTWFYPPANPLTIFDSVRSLSSPTSKKTVSDLLKSFKALRPSDPSVAASRFRAPSENAKEPFLNKNLRQTVDGMVWVGNLVNQFDNDDYELAYDELQPGDTQITPGELTYINQDSLSGVVASAVARVFYSSEEGLRDKLFNYIREASNVLAGLAIWDVTIGTSREEDRAVITVEDVMLPMPLGGIAGQKLTNYWVIKTESGYLLFDSSGDCIGDCEFISKMRAVMSLMNNWLTMLMIGDNNEVSLLKEFVEEDLYV